MEAVREFEQVGCENIRAKIVQYLRNDLAELAKLFRQNKFSRFGQHQLVHLRRRLLRFPKNRTDPDVSVLQIRRGVSLERQHLAPGKNVIGHSILRKIGIFHRANANRARNVDLFLLRQARILFLHDFARP